MANLCRKIGVNIYTFIHNAGTTPERFAKEMNYSLKDIWGVLEGKIMLPPMELDRIAKALGTSKDEIVRYNADMLAPNLAFMNELSNPELLDKILDLMDEYVEIKEAI